MSKTRRGRVWARSRARETPPDLAMMERTRPLAGIGASNRFAPWQCDSTVPAIPTVAASQPSSPQISASWHRNGVQAGPRDLLDALHSQVVLLPGPVFRPPRSEWDPPASAWRRRSFGRLVEPPESYPLRSGGLTNQQEWLHSLVAADDKVRESAQVRAFRRRLGRDAQTLDGPAAPL